MKPLVIGILFTLLSGFLSAQERKVEATYFMLVNLTEQEVTDPSGSVTLSPLDLTHVVELDIPFTQMRSVVADWGTDENHWLLRRTFPVAYLDESQPGRGVGMLPVTPEEAAFFRKYRNLVVRLSYFDAQGVYVGHTLQKEIDAQDIKSGRVSSPGKCVATWSQKKIRNQAVLGPGYDFPAR
jgi:hypothetical protein